VKTRTQLQSYPKKVLQEQKTFTIRKIGAGADVISKLAALPR
jgi:hypothetical protein